MHHRNNHHFDSFSNGNGGGGAGGVPYLPHLLPHQQQFNPASHFSQQQQPAPNNNVVETKYFMTRQGPLGTQSQANAAASFFARVHQKLQHEQLQSSSATSLSSSPQGQRRQRRARSAEQQDSSEERERFPTNFRTLVSRSPPPVPSGLLRKLDSFEASSVSGLGKIKVVLRVSKATNCFDPQQQLEHSRHFQLDQKKRQITLYDPSAFRGQQGSDVLNDDRRLGVAAPKMFAFDGLFTSEDSQEDVCSSALPDVIQAVMNGNDGCLFCFGHANLGKTRSMLGSDQCAKDMGAVPIAIAWLYKAIKERKTKTGARFSVRVSATEITSQREEIRDLLSAYETDSDQSPAVYLRSLPVQGSCLQNQSELRASSAEKAAYYLDAALAGRSLDAMGRESHLIYTLHVYQYSVDQSAKGGVHGGRSRLHLIDFGGCERTKLPGGGITLSGLGNVILGIFNGQKHLPHRESKVTKVLRECLGSLTCVATMLAHVSPEASHYSETLHTVQLASRMHRMRRKRLKAAGHSSSGSSDEHRRLSKFRSRSGGRGSGRSSSDLTTSGTSTNASSSEMSCDTVVYRGHSDGSGTDCENPPPLFVPAFRTSSSGSSVNNNNSSAPGSLRGSLDEIPRRRRILTNGAISPRRNLSPNPLQSMRSPNRSLSSLPVIHEVNTNSKKMPLNGLVPIQGRHQRNMTTRQGGSGGDIHREQQQWADPKSSNFQGHFSARKEVWIDAPPPPEKARPAPGNPARYGYMDEHKANMISTWVENQTEQPEQDENAGGFRVLTQFKQCESDESAKELSSAVKVTVHEQPKAKLPPPPPPRRTTPPRDFENSRPDNNFKALVEECNQLARTFREKESSGGGAFVRECKSEEREVENSLEHPLRILSEENLTVVSSFAGSFKDLDQVGDDHEEVDPSKLSFFEVPDFSSIKEDMDKQDNFISERFKQFAQLETKISKEKAEALDNEKLEREANKEVLLTFSRKGVNNNNNEKLKTSSSSSSDASSSNSSMTPQRNFLLLAESLRHPDGSSNPEINKINTERSPGNGRSSSDMEEAENNVFSKLEGEQQQQQTSRPPPPPHSPPQDDKANGNVGQDQCDNEQANRTEQIRSRGNEQQASKPESKGRFGFRFLRIFGSTRKLNKAKSVSCDVQEDNRLDGQRRSKSCDRKSELNVNKPLQSASSSKNPLFPSRDALLRGSIRAASSSPSIKATEVKKKQQPAGRRPETLEDQAQMANDTATPSMLSISTEWEFEESKEEAEEDGKNGNEHHYMHPHSGRLLMSQRKNDRKSSGYDSLGGESSSLDSNEDPVLKEKLQRCDGQEEETDLICPAEVPYATPSDVNDLQIIQYDELDILRMEQRLRFGGY